MSTEQNHHKWQEVEVPDGLKDTFKRKDVCVRGECKCERLLSRRGNIYQYERAKNLFNHAPKCYGDILLNEQPID